MTVKHILASSLFFASLSVSAASVDMMAVGETYYIWGAAENTPVQVREIDRVRAIASVAYPDGEVRWVGASFLETWAQARRRDIGIAGFVIGTLYCAFNDCGQDESGKPMAPLPAPTPAANAGSTTVEPTIPAKQFDQTIVMTQ